MPLNRAGFLAFTGKLGAWVEFGGLLEDGGGAVEGLRIGTGVELVN